MTTKRTWFVSREIPGENGGVIGVFAGHAAGADS